jgi:hypothetical protein
LPAGNSTAPTSVTLNNAPNSVWPTTPNDNVPQQKLSLAPKVSSTEAQPTRINVTAKPAPDTATDTMSTTTPNLTSNAVGIVSNDASAAAKAAWDGTKWLSNGLTKLETSTVGQIVLNTGAAAGSAFATGGAVTLGNVSDKASLANAAMTGGTSAVAQQFFEQQFVSKSAKAGEVFGPAGAAAAAATATASFEIGQNFIAPYAAPAVSSWMIGADQKFFAGKIFGEGTAPVPK